MKIFRSLQSTRFEMGCALTIGNYDAVHNGHQKILNRLVSKANSLGVPSVVMTFVPSPEEYFLGHRAAPRLTTLASRYFSLRPHGVDVLLVLPFKASLANTEAEEFVSAGLVGELNCKYILIGDDFRFGSGRRGDFELLQQMGQKLDFEVEQMDTVTDHGERISSTRIREALDSGRLDIARELLGHPYTMVGRINHGDKRGREWGFPTLNLAVRSSPPFTGVFAVQVEGLGRKKCDGVANLGTRPTIGGLKTLLEVHLFDFSGDVYGERICVQFISKIRDEIKFDSFDDLKAQIKEDCVSAMTVLGIS